MADLKSVLDHARKLSPEDQARLIDALWDSAPDNVELPLHAEWEAELERRVDAMKAGTQKMIPWTQIRQEALARIGHGSAD